MLKLRFKRVVSVVLSVLTAVSVVSFLAYATTVGTNVTVTGNLTVNGSASTLGDAAGDVFTFTGATIHNASTTIVAALNTSSLINASSTLLVQAVAVGNGGAFEDLGSIGADELGVEGAVEIDGVSYLDGGFISSASSTLVGTLTTTGIINSSSTSLFTGLNVGSSGFISSASSTIVGTLTMTDVINSSSTSLFTGLRVGSSGSLNSASSTAVAAFNVGGTFSASSTALFTATSTIYGGVSVGGGAEASSTPARPLSVVGDIYAQQPGTSGTTSIIVNTNGTGRGGCINLRATDGSMVRIFATSVPSGAPTSDIRYGYTRGLVVEAGSCNNL